MALEGHVLVEVVTATDCGFDETGIWCWETISKFTWALFYASVVNPNHWVLSHLVLCVTFFYFKKKNIWISHLLDFTEAILGQSVRSCPGPCHQTLKILLQLKMISFCWKETEASFRNLLHFLLWQPCWKTGRCLEIAIQSLKKGVGHITGFIYF